VNVSEPASAPPFEVHFTQGFFDDDMQVICDGAVLIQLNLTTRMQTGLAQIAALPLTNKKEVTLECKKRSLATTFFVDATTPFVSVALRDGVFDITASQHSPGYL
jgi:hypothetical protein